MRPEEAVLGWPKLKNLLHPIAPKISSLYITPVKYGQRALLRFTNDYGVEIFKHSNDDFFEMTVIRFHGPNYEFAFDTAIPDLNLGYTDEDVLNLCQDVAKLKRA
jgi:hypothetical protein